MTCVFDSVLKYRGIATPVCGLVRNDNFYFSTLLLRNNTVFRQSEKENAIAKRQGGSQ